MHRSRAYVSIVVTIILLLSTVVPAFAVTQSEADQHATKADEARKAAAAEEKEAAELKKQTAELDKRIEALRAEADALDPQIDEASGITDKLRKEVSELDADVTSLTGEIDETQVEYARQKSLLDGRMQTAYKQGTWYYLDILLGSSDFEDLIARTELVNRVIESNNNIAVNLHVTRDRLESSRVKLQRSLDTMKLKKREAEEVEQRLLGLQKTRQAKVAEQESVQRQKSDMMAESLANAKRLRAIAAEEEAESDRIERELARSTGSGAFAGTMAWPVPGFTRVSSPFGYRIHPIFKTRKLHTGIDIGRAADGTSIDGAAIVAAGSGEVIYAGYRGGYGNTVMIDHGNGVVTLYAHQRSGGIRVSVGQSVSKGDRIGTVGSTGYSTGPHLHFEVRVNGTPKDPMNYL